MSEQKATNVHWHGGEINRPERAQLLVTAAQRSGLPVCRARVRAPSQSHSSKRYISAASSFTGSMATTFV